MTERVYYKLAQLHWPSEGACIIRDDTHAQLLVLPLAFLRKGHVDTAKYVIRQVAFSFLDTEGCSLVDCKGRALDDEEKVEAGEYRLAKGGE